MHKKDIGLALAVVAGWGLNIVMIRLGATAVEPLSLLVIRYGLSILLFAPFAKKLPLNRYKDMALYALPYIALHLGLVFMALEFLQASLGGLILQTQVPFAIIIGIVFYREKIGIRAITGLILAFGGVGLILLKPDIEFSYLGTFLMLASAFMWAIGSVRMRNIRDLNMPTMMTYSYVMAFPVVLIGSLLFETSQIEKLTNANWSILSIVLAYQIILMSLALYVWKNLMSRNSVASVTAFSLLQPVFSVSFGMLLLGESVGLITLIGGAIALCGVTLIVFRKRYKKTT